MLPCPSADSRMKMPLKTSKDESSEMIHRNLPHVESHALSENTSLSRNPGTTFDPDMYWEMNYHEAAIFLEVILRFLPNII